MQTGLNDGDFALIACNRDGSLERPLPFIPEPITEACAATAQLYDRVGYFPPWTGYVAAIGNVAVGGGAFVGPPVNGRVEIAYFTLAAWQGRGVAGRTAKRLVDIARATAPGMEIYAKTLPQPNASTRVLERIGFASIGIQHDDDIGAAWGWLLA